MKPLVEATLYRDAADVIRYHTKRVQRNQTIGQHSFNMMMLVQQVSPDCRKEVLLAIMHHDLPELMTGDIPAPIKRMHDRLGPLMDEIEQDLAPLYKEFGLTPEEEQLVKWADRMELVLWCIEEYKLGNSYTRETAQIGMQWILEARVGFTPVGGVQLADQLTNDVVTEMLNMGMTISVRPLNERNEA